MSKPANRKGRGATSAEPEYSAVQSGARSSGSAFTVRDCAMVLGVAIAARLMVILWAQSRFPPAADGQFYQVVATRISQGLGYTWLWPDGAVTYAAHYPIGYPAILGGLYWLFGSHVAVAMVLNGFAGVATTFCVYRLVAMNASRRTAVGAGLVTALHPTLLFYTPAMMTELVSAALAIAAAAMALASPTTRRYALAQLLVVGLLCGVATLVRPQQLLWAPLLGAWIAWQAKQTSTSKFGIRRVMCVVGGAALASSVAIACCIPWTLRNCDKMERCVFVSANGGWNLFIGASPIGNGAWASIDSIGVPNECRLVFKEAEKDHCFGAAAKRRIRETPGAWLMLLPRKLAKTFDDVGAPGYYLHASNSGAFSEQAKWYLGVSEVLTQRILGIFAVLALALVSGPRRRMRLVLGGLAIIAFCLPYAWLGVLLFCFGTLLLGRRLLEEPELLLLSVAWAMTAVVHAVFFGGARYAIVVMPFVAVAAAQSCRLLPRNRWRGGSAAVVGTSATFPQNGVGR